MSGIPHRYLTWRYPGVGGVIKKSLEDFVVHEVPLYRPLDHGEHTFFSIEKSTLTTLEAVDRLASALEVPSGEIGFAGLKDRKAITTQQLSVRGVSPERVLALRVSQIRVLWARRHPHKIRVGHLLGNRFQIRVRGCSVSSSSSRWNLDAILAGIRRDGVPNYYGPQRFGTRGDAFRVGRALLGHRYEEAVKRILGYPSMTEQNHYILLARHHFMAGNFARALEIYPRSYRMERNLLRYLLQSRGKWRGAVKRLPHPIKKIYYSALQSAIFNAVLDRRLELTDGKPGKFFRGDLAFIHRNGAVYSVDDELVEQRRSDAGEVSPSGPVFGKMMVSPGGLEAELEREALDAFGLRPESFHQLMPGLRMRGGRRPLRVEPRELRWEINGRDVCFEFFLPKGAYATTFLREIIKTDDPAPAFYSACPERVPLPELDEAPLATPRPPADAAR